MELHLNSPKHNKTQQKYSSIIAFFTFGSCESKGVIKIPGHLKTKFFLGVWGSAMLHGTGRALSVMS